NAACSKEAAGEESRMSEAGDRPTTRCALSSRRLPARFLTELIAALPPSKRAFLSSLLAFFALSGSRPGSPSRGSATSRSSTRRSQGKNSLCANHISNPAVRAAHPSDPRRGSLSLSPSFLRLRGAQSFPLLYPLINES